MSDQPAGSAGEVPQASADALVVVPIRHWGRWVGAVAVLGALVATAKSLYSNRNIDHATVGHYLFNGLILEGVRNTLLLTVLSMVIGVVLGVLVAVLRLSPNPVLRGGSWFYTWFFRGTPVLVQIVFWGYLGLLFSHVGVGIPFTHVQVFSKATNDLVTPFRAALLALGLNEGAYMAEIVRAGIIAVDEGQGEAGSALGMTRGMVMRRIVLPQAMRVIIPPTGNETISMLKTTSLVQIISGGDLFTHQADISASNLRQVELLVVASFWYLVLTSVLSIGQFYLERRFARGSARSLPDTPWQRIRHNLLFRSGEGPLR